MQTTRMLVGGIPVSDTSLRSCAAIAVSLYVDGSVAGLDELAVRDLVAGHLPREGQSRAAFFARQLLLFASAPVGAVVITTTRRGQRPLAGRVTGGYRHAPVPFPGNPHVRPVEWGGYLPAWATLDDRLHRTVYPAGPALARTAASVAPAPDPA